MIHNRKNKINLLSFVLGFTICLALMIGIVLVNSENIAHAEGEAIDTLEVAFNKTNVGDSLVTAFEFEDKATKKTKSASRCKLYSDYHRGMPQWAKTNVME